jgi:hypothetical protein
MTYKDLSKEAQEFAQSITFKTSAGSAAYEGFIAGFERSKQIAVRQEPESVIVEALHQMLIKVDIKINHADLLEMPALTMKKEKLLMALSLIKQALTKEAIAKHGGAETVK